jgi:hypothetical protein
MKKNRLKIWSISLIMFLIFMFSQRVFAVEEEWVNRCSLSGNGYGEEGKDLTVDADGNVIVVGLTGGDGGTDYDAAVIKISSSGQTLWSRVFGPDIPPNSFYDYFNKVIVDDENDIYTIGTSYDASTSSDLHVVKLDISGNAVWDKTFASPGRDYGSDIIFDSEGYLYLSGTFNGSSYYFLAKLEPVSGNIIWEKHTDVNGYCSGSQVTLDNVGNIYQGGTADGPGANNWDWIVIKYDSLGNIAWYRTDNGNVDTVGGGWMECARYICVGREGNIYAAGTLKEINKNDIHIKKYSPDGTELWSRTYDGGYGFDMCNGMVLDDDGNAYLVGSETKEGDYTDLVVLKYNSNGERKWLVEYDYAGKDDEGYDITIDDSNGVYVTGASHNANDQYPDDYVTLKLNANTGEQIWVMRYNGPDSTTDEARAIYRRGDNIYVTGRSHLWSTWYDFVTIKYAHATAIEEQRNRETKDVALDFSLSVFPNPFSKTTVIELNPRLSGSPTPQLKIYDLSGRLIRTFPSSLLSLHPSVTWDGRDDSGKEVKNGVYFIKLVWEVSPGGTGILSVDYKKVIVIR